MRKIGIVGAGQAGLQLGLGLLQDGYEVVLVSNQTADQIARGRVTSSQCMFDRALANERALGIDFWQDAPPVEGIQFALVQDGTTALRWSSRLDKPARSVDQRVKMPRWMDEFERAGGELRILDAGLDDLEALHRECDLVIVASGKGEIGKLFQRDGERSPFDKPQRALALTYVHGMKPRAPHSAVNFNLVPGIGEYFVFPALTLSGPCEIMVFEGLPGGPMDRWGDVRTPQEHLAESLRILRQYVPAEYERAKDVVLTDDLGVLSGRFPPTVRKPILTLPSGALALGMGDSVCLNDPITGQGANNASHCAALYRDAIVEHGDRPVDGAFLQATFEHYSAFASI
ncbi:styrene monooxygenase/indole monooxygenase family protein [Aurantimonas sp. Leaf443]|uniref:styrene monooxygenase/indole monooxygenase family protein n=1 Tax=Aurantimonas sp. Leaf443 TaxID=1736378 RepID=UPI000AFCC5ED|nr:styrene monooxygenase/indole monooxygenase family protein [Aurantimonas sp. Leaf443]